MQVSVRDALKIAYQRQLDKSIEDAIKIYLAVSKLQETSFALWYNLAICYFSTSQMSEARICFEKATLIDENYEKNHALLEIMRNYDVKGEHPGVEINSSSFLCDPENEYENFISAYPYEFIFNLYSQNEFHKIVEYSDKVDDKSFRFVDSMILVSAAKRQTGDIRGATKIYESLRQKFPTNFQVINNLGNIYLDTGRLCAAVECFSQAVQIDPQSEAAMYNLGKALSETSELIEANKYYHKSLLLMPNFPHPKIGLAENAMKVSDYEAAVSLFEEVLLNASLSLQQTRYSNDSILKCLAKSRKWSALIDRLKEQSRLEYLSAAQGLYAGLPEVRGSITNRFCDDPLSYIRHIELNAESEEVASVRNLAHQIVSVGSGRFKPQPLISNGSQTAGNLFLEQSDTIKNIEILIRSEIQKYRISFNNHDVGFIKKWPDAYNLYGWIVSYKSGGVIHPHIHENGWISGSLYLQVPKDLKGADGALFLSTRLGEKAETFDHTNDAIVRVKSGSLCLFPASLMHSTLPFSSSENRIVLAFDMIPLTI